MTLRFRDLRDEPGQPTSEIVDELAPWIVAASRPFADWYFGEPDVAAEIVREWIARPTSELFVGRAIVVDDGGETAGCIIAVPGGQLATYRAADFAAFYQEISGEPEADNVIAEVIAASRELFVPVADDDLYISRVGVAPGKQGQGIGRALVLHVIERCRDLGLQGCRLDVSADNPAAIRAYGAAGLTVTSTRHSEIADLRYCAMRMDV